MASIILLSSLNELSSTHMMLLLLLLHSMDIQSFIEVIKSVIVAINKLMMSFLNEHIYFI